MSVLDVLIEAERDTQATSLRVLQELQSVIQKKSADYGPVSSVVDILAAATGYHRATIPASEVLACYRIISKITRYMTLRAQSSGSEETVPNFEGIDDTLLDIVGEGARLYAACLADIGERKPATPVATNSRRPVDPEADSRHVLRNVISR